jgi:hypothetical protein
MNAEPSAAGPHPVIVMPVFNDWDAFQVLVRGLDDVLARHGERAAIVAVDDGSFAPLPNAPSGLAAIATIQIVRLKRNLGHQRAIAIGLSYVLDAHPGAPTIVMDSDGEDQPEDAVRLLRASRETGGTAVLFARRARRSEPLWFRAFYVAYKIGFRVMTGHGIHFGNFSVIPGALLERVAGVSEIWNHYSAGIMKARVPFQEIDTSRGRRIAGRSSMRVTALFTHGISSIAVFAETVGTRLCVAAAAVGGLVSLAVILVVAIRLFTDLAIPGWATYVVGLLILMLMQSAMFCFLFLLLVLSGRNAIGFIPQQHYQWYIASVDTRVGETWAVSPT